MVYAGTATHSNHVPVLWLQLPLMQRYALTCSPIEAVSGLLPVWAEAAVLAPVALSASAALPLAGGAVPSAAAAQWSRASSLTAS